jgi:dihydroorotate dehydrogenase (fumarate)
MGFNLKNPIVVSSSPISEEIGRIREVEDAGGAAVVLHSLFEEQIVAEEKGLDKYLSQGTESFAEALTYLPDFKSYPIGPEEYLAHIQKTKKAVDIPIIGSLNGISDGNWIRYAKSIQDAGADALELNIFSIPTDIKLNSETIENRIVTLVKNIKQSIRIPIAVKISPFFSSIPNMANQLDGIGVEGIVLFNRFYQPDIDLEKKEVVSNLILSTSAELRLRLR